LSQQHASTEDEEESIGEVTDPYRSDAGIEPDGTIRDGDGESDAVDGGVSEGEDSGGKNGELSQGTSAIYPEPTSVLTKEGGVNWYNGRKETWYSQRVLPGGGLDIPGRHVDERGLICDVDGYICVAASDLAYGSIVATSLGLGKVYDSGCEAGVTDIYTDW